MFSSDRTTMRRFFLDAWRKAQDGEPLQPLEQLMADVIRRHPEYHRLLGQGETALAREFLPEQGESNPFLHMAMHISLQEQLGGDRPPGIRGLYQQLAGRLGDAHEAEHQLMECLARSLWEAQRAGRMPDEGSYLECIRQLVERGTGKRGA